MTVQSKGNVPYKLHIWLKNGSHIIDEESSFENAAADLYNYYILDEQSEIVRVVIE